MREDLEVRTIVLGYDGSDEARRALERAAEIAGAFGATVVVTSVTPDVPGVYGGTDPLMLPPAGAPRFPLEEQLGVPGGAEQAERLLADARAALETRGVEARTEARVGLPADEIVAVARESSADLIVVGTHEPGFLERLFVGSVSEGVVRKAHCDVLVVHPEPE